MIPRTETIGALGGAGLLVVVMTACGASSADSELSTGNGQPRSPGGDTSGAPADDAGVPAEREVESYYQAPVATGKYVWVANPKSGRIAYINAETLDVRTVEAGNGPTYLAVVPAQTADTTIVLNVLSDDATLLRADGPNVTARTFKTAHAMNSWAMSADGRWAIAWTDARKTSALSDKTQGFQDLTVIDMTAQVAPQVLAVGYRPVTVGFDAQSRRGYAVTQDGIAVVDLFPVGGAPRVLKNVALSDDPLDDPGTRDVSVTPDGAYALVRRDNRSDVTVVALESGTRTTVTLPGPVTDLDLSPKGDRAVAVIRQSATVAVLPVPGIASNPATFTTAAVTGETIGSVSLAATGDTGVLYTNAVPSEHITVLGLSGNAPTFRTIRLYQPVLGVFLTPDAAHAVVLHDAPAPPSTKAGAFSLVPLGTTLPAKIVGTDAPLTAVALSPTSDRAVITERDDKKKIFGVYLVKLPELAETRYPLASPPIAAGVVGGARRAYVSQQHPDGRITFLDLDTGLARTLTGFELAARVVDGSKP
jgi:DNA-binding beta-propeller fold protein YncE